MQILVRCDTAKSKAKLTLIRTLLKMHFLKQHRGSSKSASSWNAELVPDASDSERCVEVPWTASAIANTAGLWMDVGYANAEPRYWEAVPADGFKAFFRYGYGLDLCSPKGTDPLAVHVIADLSQEDISPLPNFDLITCISTLEHVGCDNKIYHPDATRREKPFQIQTSVLQKNSSENSAAMGVCCSASLSEKPKITAGSCNTTRR
jgi:hypothetical protein